MDPPLGGAGPLSLLRGEPMSKTFPRCVIGFALLLCGQIAFAETIELVTYYPAGGAGGGSGGDQ